MVAICPACKYEYEVEHGKYQCGICGTKFFIFKDGRIEIAAPAPVPEERATAPIPVVAAIPVVTPIPAKKQG
ncbi:MAG: hypothetical protein IKC94_03585 [Lentisphaeria bacterium]|nr:hypothetical protein [Lentisphaeria bacterium]